MISNCQNAIKDTQGRRPPFKFGERTNKRGYLCLIYIQGGEELEGLRIEKKATEREGGFCQIWDRGKSCNWLSSDEKKRILTDCGILQGPCEKLRDRKTHKRRE